CGKELKKEEYLWCNKPNCDLSFLFGQDDHEPETLNAYAPLTNFYQGKGINLNLRMPDNEGLKAMPKFKAKSKRRPEKIHIHVEKGTEGGEGNLRVYLISLEVEEKTRGIPRNKKTYLIPKKIVKNSPKFKFKHEPDYLILKKETKTLYITELKDGDAFDTKKSAGETEALRQFKNHISENVPYKTLILVCCFNQVDKKKIIQGFKNKIKPSEAFTGQEFCELTGIDYQAIVKERTKRHPKENLKFFCNELLRIDECRKIILEILQKN
ncbi:21161_t:CDS:2, partial [Racocetra persica]